MNNVDKIKLMVEWVKKHGKTPFPKELLGDFDEKTSTWMDHSGSTPWMLNGILPPEVLEYTEEDMEDEIDKMENKVNKYHTEDCENMQELSEQTKPSI